MARVQVLGQGCRKTGKMLVRGVYTQKKKLWEAMEEVFDGKLADLNLFDDVSDKTLQASYKGLCERLRVMGRATLVSMDGERVFQVIDAETNELRGWDVDEDGKPVCNPVSK
jgi:hypothetical protein